MDEHMRTVFYENPGIYNLIKDFCCTDPEYLQFKREFYESAQMIQDIVGFDLYEYFEDCFHIYMAKYAELHYLFGLGLRQEILRAFW